MNCSQMLVGKLVTGNIMTCRHRLVAQLNSVSRAGPCCCTRRPIAIGVTDVEICAQAIWPSIARKLSNSLSCR